MSSEKSRILTWMVFAGVCMLSIAFPLIAIPAVTIGVILTEGRLRKSYSFLLAILLSIVAYVWEPDASMDLFRHHIEVKTLLGASAQKISSMIAQNLEPAHYIIDYLIAQTRNVNLLQFAVVLLGYFELFWIICDYSDAKKAKKSTFVFMAMYAFSAVSFINYASGLWCNFAIINLALAVYLQFFRNAKWLQYVFYAFAAFLHAGTVYMVILVLLFSKLRIFKKTRLSVICIVFVAIFSIGSLIAITNNTFGSETVVMAILNKMYEGYFIKGSQFNSLHTGWNLYLSVASIIFGLILLIPRKTKEVLSGYRSLIIYTSVGLLATIVHAGVFIRFSFLMAILLVPVLYEYMEGGLKEKRVILLASLAVISLSTLQLSRSYMQAKDAGLLNDARKNMAYNLIDIMRREKE